MADVTDALKSLHTALIDSRAGYAEALADAEGKGLTALFRDMIELRSKHHAEIDRLLRDAGQTPDEHGSFMSTVHRTIIKVRSILTGLDESVLPGLIDGEKRIVSYYDDVENGSLGAAAVMALGRQRQEVEAQIARMQTLLKS